MSAWVFLSFLLPSITKLNLKYRNWISFWYFTMLCCVTFARLFLSILLIFFLPSLSWFWITEFRFGISQCYAMSARLFLSSLAPSITKLILKYRNWISFWYFTMLCNTCMIIPIYSAWLLPSITKLILKYRISFWYFTILFNVCKIIPVYSSLFHHWAESEKHNLILYFTMLCNMCKNIPIYSLSSFLP